MTALFVCDRRGCPAMALNHIELYGQDFHFCGHHWAQYAAEMLLGHDSDDAPADSELLTGGAPRR